MEHPEHPEHPKQSMVELDAKDYDNCVRKSLKEMDVTMLTAIQHLSTACQIFSYLLRTIDPVAEKSRPLLDEEAASMLRLGCYISRDIATTVDDTLVKKPKKQES